jgi:hypothetical protein
MSDTSPAGHLGSVVQEERVAGRPEGYTRGDALRMLKTYPPGMLWWQGWNKNWWLGLDIRPFDQYYSGGWYYAEDPHVLALMWSASVIDSLDSVSDECLRCINDVYGYPFATIEDASGWLQEFGAKFYLDGEEIALERSPVKPLLNEPWALEVCQYELMACDTRIRVLQLGFQWGKVLDPCFLSPGAHAFGAVVTIPPVGDRSEPEVWRDSAHITVNERSPGACEPR